MEIALALALFVLGLALVVGSAEKVVDGALGTAIGFGISAFLVSVVFLGFDPENLAVGAVGAYEDVPGFALGSIVGAAMVAVALAFGVTALLAPMSFETAPDAILGVPWSPAPSSPGSRWTASSAASTAPSCSGASPPPSPTSSG